MLSKHFLLDHVTLKVEAVWQSEKLIFYHIITRRHKPQRYDLHFSLFRFYTNFRLDNITQAKVRKVVPGPKNIAIRECERVEVGQYVSLI